MKRQTRDVLALLRARGPDGLTAAEAHDQLACDRLAARIHELRDAGYHIPAVRERSPIGATYARYVLSERPELRAISGVQDGLAL